MKPKNSKTQQLLALAQRQFGENIQIEYKPGGVTSGWYLSKNDYSYCIGKNEFEATLWLGRVPNLTKPSPFTTHIVSWINLGYQEYLDHAIACQLTDQTECSRPANNTQPFEIITTFQQINACNSALLVLIWALGMPIKRFIGYYPDLVLVGESVDKNAFIQRIENTVWADTLPGFLQKKDGIPKILIGTSSHISPNEFPETVKIELFPTTQQPPPSLIAQWPVTEWLDFLCSINRSEFDDILGHCYQDYCHVTAPSVPDKVNNTVIMLLTWKLICLFLGHPLRWESNGEGVDDVDISIHSYV